MVLFLICINSKNPNILKKCHYVIYILLIFSAADLRYPIVNFIYTKNYVLLLLIVEVEILFRLVWVILNIFSFYEFLNLNVINSFLIFFYFYPTSHQENIQFTIYYFLCYTLLFTIISVLAYIIDKKNKTSFFLQIEMYEKNQHLNILLENINTGVLHINKNEIVYVNKFTLNLFSSFFQNTFSSKNTDHQENHEFGKFFII
jgi:hypothetical protein